jgi:glycosyltransferase involved in cell wall biosynthesis
MKIILLHYSAPPVVGGVESVLGQHARLMSDAGHAVAVVAGRGSQVDSRIPFLPLPLADSLHPEVLKVKAGLDRGVVPPEFEPLAAQLTAALDQLIGDADVVIAHNVCSLHKNLALTAAIKNLFESPRRARLILWHHDLAWATPRYRPELHPGPPWDLLRKPPAKAVHVAVSELRRDELADLLGIPADTIAVIPNGLDLSRFFKLEGRTRQLLGQLDLLHAAPILLLPVRITPRKNIELALRVLHELRKDYPSAVLVVTGPPGPHNPDNRHYLERLHHLRRELGLSEAAHFLTELSDDPSTPFVPRTPATRRCETAGSGQDLPDAVVADFYRLADLLFLPSREEGFGIPILEAGLSGLPIFCADIPPLRALADGRAEFFDPEADPAELAGRIARCLEADGGYRLRARVRQEYNWERIFAGQIAPLLKAK